MKRTKMIIGLVLALVLCMSFALTACDNGPADTTGTTAKPTEPSNQQNPTGTTAKPTEPSGSLEISVVPAEMEMYAGEEIDPMFGVTVNNPDAKLFISDDNDFDAEVPGTYVITYSAVLGDVTVTATRTITVLNAKSDIAVEVTHNHLGDTKWQGKVMAFKNGMYQELSANTELPAQTGIFKNVSDSPIVLTVGGSYGCSAIVDANGVVIEGRDGANSKLVNAQNPERASSSVTTMTVGGESVSVSSAFAKEMTIPAGGYAIVVQSNAFGSTADTDGRGFMNYNVIRAVGNVIRLYWVDTDETLTPYINQQPTVSGNNKILVPLDDETFDFQTAVLAGLSIKDDAGTFELSDDVTIEEITIVNDGGFNIHTVGTYVVTMSVTDGSLTTEFTREVEVKSDGVATLFIGENKLNVALEKVAINQELTMVGSYAFIIYTSDYEGTIAFANGHGEAFIVDEYGVIVRIYDGANGKFYDAENPEGLADACNPTGYINEAFESLQPGETLIIAPHTDTNSAEGGSRRFLLANRTIGAQVSGLGMEFTKTTASLTIGENTLEVPLDMVIMDQQLEKADAYAFIIYTYSFKANGGTIGFTNGHGEAIVVNQYGEIVRIYDGANGKYYDAANPAGVQDGTCTGAGYDEEAFASLQEGEILIIAPHTNTNSADGGSRKFLLGNRTFGAVISGLDLTFEVKATTYTFTVGSNSMEVGKELVIVDQQLDKADAYAFIIYTYGFKANGGTIGFTNGHGEAIVVNQYGEIVRIYDGANGKYYDAANPSGVQNGTCTGTGYDEEAFASLQEGEILIIAPHTNTNSADGGSRKFLLGNRTFGAVVSGLGLTFEAKEN